MGQLVGVHSWQGRFCGQRFEVLQRFFVRKALRAIPDGLAVSIMSDIWCDAIGL